MMHVYLLGVTSSAVVVDVQIQTSADDGNGNSGLFMYKDNTVFKIFPKYNKVS